MLKGKTALVTGGSRGIGRAIALKLAENGADVAIVYAGRQDAAEETRRDIEALGVKAAAYQCDAADFDAVKVWWPPWARSSAGWIFWSTTPG